MLKTGLHRLSSAKNFSSSHFWATSACFADRTATPQRRRSNQMPFTAMAVCEDYHLHKNVLYNFHAGPPTTMSPHGSACRHPTLTDGSYLVTMLRKAVRGNAKRSRFLLWNPTPTEPIIVGCGRKVFTLNPCYRAANGLLIG